MENLLGGGLISFSPLEIVVNIIGTFILAAIIALVYKRTYKGFSYSQSFVFTLVIMSIVVTIVMMVIGNSLARAFGLLGAFSIIRFRTPVKDTKDTAYIFFALAIGMAMGTSNHLIGVIGTVLVIVIIWLLYRFNFGSVRVYDYILSFSISHRESDNSETNFEQFFKKYFKNTLLLNIQTKQEGRASIMAYQVTFFDDKKKQDFIRELSGMEGVDKVELIAATDNVEY